MLSQEEEVSQDGLGNEDGGDTKGELSFLRFVPEEVHPQECADAASCDRHPDEGRLRYAPLPSAGLPFVDSEDKEGQDIDADRYMMIARKFVLLCVRKWTVASYRYCPLITETL